MWAEDSDSDQFLVRAVLQGTPQESSVHFVHDGHQALKEIARSRPDGVVLDVNMPNMDGVTALRRIRAEHGDLPVVMFSTATDADEIKACRDLGVLAYATKPVDFDAFAVVVNGVLSLLQGQSVALPEPRVVELRPSTSGNPS